MQVEPGDPANPARFEVAPSDIVAELAAVAAAPRLDEADLPFRLAVRRMRDVQNTMYHTTPESRARAPTNFAYLHPGELARLGLEPYLDLGMRLGEGTGAALCISLARAAVSVLTDMASSLRGMGFTNVILMGDSGGNQGPMKEVAAALDEKYKASGTRFYFIPEYYDYSSVQKLIQSSGIPEKIEIGASQGSDGLHEEYGIDALMALYDPKTIRIDERTKANRATINGVPLLPMSKTLEM